MMVCRNIQGIVIVILALSMVVGCRLPIKAVESAGKGEEDIQSKINNSIQNRQPPSPEELTSATSRSWIGHRIPIRRRDLPQQIPDELEKNIALTYIEPVRDLRLVRLAD